MYANRDGTDPATASLSFRNLYRGSTDETEFMICDCVIAARNDSSRVTGDRMPELRNDALSAFVPLCLAPSQAYPSGGHHQANEEPEDGHGMGKI